MSEDYDGLEIIFIDVGQDDNVGDSILLRDWDGGESTNILVDGGTKEASKAVIKFLDSHGVKRIHHMVCSHFHNDHAGGLIRILDEAEHIKVDNGWMHIPRKHTNEQALRKSLNRIQAQAASVKAVRYAERVEASLDDADELERAFRDRGITPEEPFQGTEVGFIRCLGPSVEFYEARLDEHRAESAIQQSADALFKTHRDYTLARVKAAEHRKAPGWPDSPSTSSANNTSTIFEVLPRKEKIILTADAGVKALDHAHGFASLSDAHFVQIPHHGSRHNLTPEWVKRFGASRAYVSAPGSKDTEEGYYVHPAKCVVNDFQDEGATVYSTHASGRAVRKKYGKVPKKKWDKAEPLPHGWPDG